MFFIKVQNGKVIGKGEMDNIKLSKNDIEVTENIYNQITDLPCDYKVIRRDEGVVNEIELDQKSLQEAKLQKTEAIKKEVKTKNELEKAQRHAQLIDDLSELGLIDTTIINGLKTTKRVVEDVTDE